MGHRVVQILKLESKSWTSMWKIQVHSKLKIFVWRLANQSLPDLLHHLNKSSTLRCTLCGAADSWRHCLLECAMVRNIWSLGDEEVVEHLFATTRPSAKHWIFSLVDLFSYEMFIKVLISLWEIWTVRRKAIHEQIFQSA
jgi:hypothetical protein